MVWSKCPKCEKSGFELAEETPLGSAFKLMFVRCSSCKTVVGVTDYLNTNELIYKLAERLKINLDSTIV